MSRLYSVVLLVAFLFATVHVSGQSVRAALDSTTIFVGGQVGLNVTVSYPEGTNAEYLQFADTVTKSIEVVDRMPIDTAKTNGMVVLTQRYIVTSFDTALHYIPPIEMLRLEAGSISTNDISLNVVNPFQSMEIDEQTGVAKITDIKEPQDAPFILAELLEYVWWFVGGVLVIIAIVVGIILYRKYYAGKEVGEKKVQKPKEPCHVVAMRDLDRIKEEKLWQRNMFKEYYSDITEVLRKYLEERYGVNALESTSDEIMDMMKPLLSERPQEYKNLSSILTLADLAKFAKMEPLPDENDMAIKRAIEFVRDTTQVESQPQKEEDKQ